MYLVPFNSLVESYGVAGSIVTGLISLFLLAFGIYATYEAYLHFRIGTLAPDPKGDAGTVKTPLFVRWGWRLLLALLLLIASAINAVAALNPILDQLHWFVAYIAVMVMGGGVGAAELVSRYKDRPTRALKTAPAFFYIVLNALGSIAALYLIVIYAPKIGLPPDPSKWGTGDLVQAVLIAGFSSLLFFRTSVFKIRVGDTDLAVGPSIVLDTLLGAADRAVDRVMAEPRAAFVHKLMGDLWFERVAVILPGHCIALMQNIASEESQHIAAIVNSLRADKEMPDKIKVLNLGLALLTVVGEKVLATAVDGLRGDLQDSTAKLLNDVADVMRGASFDHARTMLPSYCFALWSKPIPQDQQDKFSDDAKALSLIPEVPDEYKALLIGIRLARLTDGATLRKAVQDLGAAIRVPPRQSNQTSQNVVNATPPAPGG